MTGAVSSGSSVNSPTVPSWAGRGPAQGRRGAVLQDGQQVVGQVDVALVELVDEQDAWQSVRQQGGAQRAKDPDVSGMRLLIARGRADARDDSHGPATKPHNPDPSVRLSYGAVKDRL
ncbi:hypothetical protein GCM10017667_68950 [Streptomyces filamentosus]|uniref:Uncharacterized protein n=1 Tax=Streptomyces filamentosus TaxID=67294 RepID=A0A919BXV3_STRFL|nr:hypothetical protein GCM10017667_68950 [Streptomyces filamentosus]